MPKATFLNLPEEKRQWITDCAVEEFAEYGYDAASISRIVAAAGIAKGSFYQYFEDKEDLYGYVIDYAIVERKMKISEEESEKLKDISLTEFIRLLFHHMMQEFIHRPKLLKIRMDFFKHQYDPVQQRIYTKYKHISDNYFQSFIQAEKSRHEIDLNVDDDVLSAMLVGASTQISVYAAANGYGFMTGEYIDNLVDKIEYILTNGIYGKNTQPRA